MPTLDTLKGMGFKFDGSYDEKSYTKLITDVLPKTKIDIVSMIRENAFYLKKDKSGTPNPLKVNHIFQESKRIQKKDKVFALIG